MGKKRRSRKEKQTRRVVSHKTLNILGEVAYIARRAAACDARVVSLGPLVFFSTETGDAWALDPADGFALCLAKDGIALPVDIKETGKRYAVRWNAVYWIEGDAFVYKDSEGREKVVIGYPITAIIEACSRVLE